MDNGWLGSNALDAMDDHGRLGLDLLDWERRNAGRRRRIPRGLDDQWRGRMRGHGGGLNIDQGATERQDHAGGKRAGHLN
jgi:hypothetical protein